MNDYESAILPPRFAPLVRRRFLGGPGSASVSLLVGQSDKRARSPEQVAWL